MIRWYLTLLLFSLSLPCFAVPTLGHKMMASAPTTQSIDVAKKIMEKGGNVVDVAVAISLTLAVTNPRHAALGGGGFALVKMNGKDVEALDFREVAPLKAHSKYYLDKDKMASRDGAHAIGVPGFPAGLKALHQKYGKLHWSLLFDDPIKLAKDGHRISGENAARTLMVKDKFNKAGLKYFFKKNGVPYKPGEIIKQRALANALKEMRNRGTIPFYEGNIARDIVSTVQKAGGILSLKDMQHYRVRWLKPITTEYMGHKLYLMPPPSSGGLIIASSLKMLEKLESQKLAPLSTEELHYLGEVMKINFRNRPLLGDPDFHKNPVDEFLDSKKIASWAEKIKKDKALDIKPIEEEKSKESDQTTHYTVMDSQGNAVTMTVTLNGTFGSKVVSEKYGIALNNEMDDFTTRPGEPNLFGLVQGQGNLVEPGKRPLSSMSPTLVEDIKSKKVVMALGAPGGPRIITGVLQTLYRVLANNYDMDQAIQTPRVHQQFIPNILYVDEKRLPPQSLEALRELGHDVKEGWHSIVNGVRMNKEGFLEGAFDSRAEGGAGGI